MSESIEEVVLVPCKCGRDPERNASLLGYAFSLSCCCGGDEINYMVRSNSLTVVKDNWHSLITGQPYKHYIQLLPKPDAHVVVPLSLDEPWDHCPLRRYTRRTGGHCSGGGGAC